VVELITMNQQVPNNELHRIATTCIIYNEDGKFLITKRSLTKKAFPGMWHVLGGGLMTDDYVNTVPQDALGNKTPDHPQWYFSLEKTLRREVMEEVGLEIGKPEYLLDLTFLHPVHKTPVLVLSYYAAYVSGDITFDADTIDSKWVTLDEAKSYDLIPGIWDELMLVSKILKGRK
jgi:8-oxo-dGTP pyrophosphatase MutT (NUDIX family)